jgi:hypothetical protein
MFDHGLCVHLIRIALIEEIALPGMMAHIRLVTKQREKAKKLAEKIIESDQEFEENLNLIEMQANTQSQEKIQSQLPAQLEEQTELQEPNFLAANTPEAIVIAPKSEAERKRRLYQKRWRSLLILPKRKI